MARLIKGLRRLFFPVTLMTLVTVLSIILSIQAIYVAFTNDHTAAIYAAVAAGLYPNVIEASKTLGSDFEAEYLPKKEEVKIYAQLMQEYKELGAFAEKSATRKINQQ